MVGAALGTGVLLGPLSTSATTGIEADALLQENCTSCHGSEMYTRPERKIQSLSSLQTQVETCNTNLGTGLFPEEVEAIANLLDEEYYKFGQ